VTSVVFDADTPGNTPGHPHPDGVFCAFARLMPETPPETPSGGGGLGGVRNPKKRSSPSRRALFSMGTGVKPMGRGDKNGFNQSLRRRPIWETGFRGCSWGCVPGGVRMVFLGVPGRRCRLVLGRDLGRCRCWTFHKLFHLRQQVVPDGCRMWAVRMRTELARRQRVCEAGTATTQSNVHLRLQESCSGRRARCHAIARSGASVMLVPKTPGTRCIALQDDSVPHRDASCNGRSDLCTTAVPRAGPTPRIGPTTRPYGRREDRLGTVGVPSQLLGEVAGPRLEAS
jgi:hypothetical protein